MGLDSGIGKWTRMREDIKPVCLCGVVGTFVGVGIAMAWAAVHLIISHPAYAVLMTFSHAESENNNP